MINTIVDLSLLLFAVGAFIAGWERGLLVSFISLTGVASGLAVARAVITSVETPSNVNPLSEFVWIAGVLFGTVIIGSALGARVGRDIREGLNAKALILIDSVGGAIFSLAAWSIVLWYLASALAVAPISSVTHILGQSKVLESLDAQMPNSVRTGMNRLQIYVAVNKLPILITDTQNVSTLPEPTPEITDDPDIVDALDSVVRVEGVSSACKVSVSGSGFVVSKKLVMTNAHVVAGTSHVGVRVKGKGHQLDGTVVYFNPNLDVALIHVEKLKSPKLEISKSVTANETTVVAGFPGGGGLDLIPATVSRATRSQGTDIYGTANVTRKIYTIKSDIKHGDSGAALLTATGEVAGMVFAASATDSSIGFVLAPSEFTEAIAQMQDSKKGVETGQCMPN